MNSRLVRTSFTIDQRTLEEMKSIRVVNWSALVREFLAAKVREFTAAGEVRIQVIPCDQKKER